MELNEIGKYAEKCLIEIPNHYAITEIDYQVIMPNHVHCIIIINPSNNVEICQGKSVTREREYGKPIKNSLSTIIKQYKGSIT